MPTPDAIATRRIDHLWMGWEQENLHKIDGNLRRLRSSRRKRSIGLEGSVEILPLPYVVAGRDLIAPAIGLDWIAHCPSVRALTESLE